MTPITTHMGVGHAQYAHARPPPGERATLRDARTTTTTTTTTTMALRDANVAREAPGSVAKMHSLRARCVHARERERDARETRERRARAPMD